jgi:hypothetical protein
LHYPDGRTAALEVSSAGPDDEAPIQHFLGNRGHSKVVPGVAGTWIVELLATRRHLLTGTRGEGLCRRFREPQRRAHWRHRPVIAEQVLLPDADTVRRLGNAATCGATR